MAQLTVTTLFMAPATSIGVGLSKVETLVASSSNGDKWLNTGKEVALLQNSSSQGAGSAVTVTVVGQVPDNFGGAATLHNLTISVPSSSFGMMAIGPFAPTVFNDANGFCNLTYSAAGLNIGIVSIAPRS